jgi:carboxymethylenebutenolidase
MCYSPEAMPPKAPRSGYFLESRRLVLDTEDGGRAPAAYAKSIGFSDLTEDDVQRGRVSDPVVYRAGSRAPVGVVILPDQRGLHVFYERLADTFADAGIQAVAVDFYHRSAGTAFRGDDFDFSPHRGQVTTESMAADANAGADFLRGQGARRIFALGFCFGGRGALLQATNPAWDGVVGFYGFPTRESPDGRSPMKDAANGDIKVPVLGLFGADDETVGRDAPHEYREALNQVGAEHEIAVYPGAAHSFFDRHAESQKENCASAWERVLQFMS